MKIKPIIFSVGGAIIISLLFTISLFWVFYEYSGSLDSARDAISTSAGYFGGITTLWAAIIAAYLFNDWRESQKYINQINISNNMHTSINDYQKSLDTYIDTIWKSRFDPDNHLMKQIQDFDEVSLKREALEDLLVIFKINFEKNLEIKIDIEPVDSYLKEINLALKQIHPFSLKQNVTGCVKEKYREENAKLMYMSNNLYRLYKDHIRTPSLNFLYKEALT